MLGFNWRRWMWMRHNLQLPTENFTSKSSRWGRKSAQNGSSQRSFQLPRHVISCRSDDNTSTVNDESTTFECVKFSFILRRTKWIIHEYFSSPRIEISPYWIAERWKRVVHTRQLLFAAVYKNLFIYLSILNVMRDACLSSCLPELCKRCIASSRTCLPDYVMTHDEV